MIVLCAPTLPIASEIPALLFVLLTITITRMELKDAAHYLRFLILLTRGETSLTTGQISVITMILGSRGAPTCRRTIPTVVSVWRVPSSISTGGVAFGVHM